MWDQHASRGTTTSIERFLEVQTWYLDGVYVPLNDEMRPVVLSDDFTTWESDLRRVWHDMEDASLEVGFVLIQPAPPSSPLASIHVLLYQQIDIGHVGTIITTYDTAVPHSRPHSTAAVCADWVDKLHVIQRIGRTLDCIRAGVSCRVWHGRHEIENDMHPINHGTNLQLHIHRASLVSWDPDDEADTDIALLQIASPASTPVPASASDSTLLEPSEGFLALWQQKFATERSDSIRVSTWLVCPGQQLFFCRTPRTVRLHANLHTWVSSFAQTWELPTDFAQHLRIVLIEPSPIAMEVDLAAHVLLILHPRVDMIVSLVTIFDTAINQEHPFRTAIVTSENITPAEVIERTGYTDVLNRADPQTTWCIRHAVFSQPVVHSAPGNDGDCLVLTISRPPDVPPSDDTGDSENTRQHVTLDIRIVQSKMAWFDCYFTLPIFDVECVLQAQAHWSPPTLPWIRTQWFANEQPVDTVRIYYDGSFLPTTRSIGFAAAAFVKIGNTWQFAGAISGFSKDGGSMGSYKAETHASILASKFLFDICKIQKEVFHRRPHCELIFDSLTVGRQSAGLWKATKAITTCHVIRGILRLCETRFGIQIEHTFCPSHRGEPGQ